MKQMHVTHTVLHSMEATALDTQNETANTFSLNITQCREAMKLIKMLTKKRNNLPSNYER